MRHPSALRFTLLEILIVLVILGFASGAVGYQLKKLLDNHRFETEVSKLFLSLQEAQVLSACYQTDIQLNVYKKGDKVYYCFSTDEPFPKEVFSKEAIHLKQTHALKFQDRKIFSLHVDIYSGGRLEPRGILSFSQDPESEKALWIDMQYGHILKLCHQKPQRFQKTIPNRTNT